MTKQQFLELFYCTFTIEDRANFERVLTSQVIRRSGDTIVDQVTTTLNIQETNEWVIDSHSVVSLIAFDWDKIIDQAKRAQLDYFVQRAPIDDFLPMNTVDNPDISDMYQ